MNILPTPEQLDIRDIDCGQTYYVVINASGRCVNTGMFRAAWLDMKDAKDAASLLGDGFKAIKTRKPEGAGY